MKRRTFIKALLGVGSLLAVWNPLRGAEASGKTYDKVHRTAGYILMGRTRGCSSPFQNEDGHVNLEKGLIELESRHS
ncbi:MAG: hypothetical protein WBM02_05310 [bacterium]